MICSTAILLNTIGIKFKNQRTSCDKSTSYILKDMKCSSAFFSDNIRIQLKTKRYSCQTLCL